jgi:hypothetical protein
MIAADRGQHRQAAGVGAQALAHGVDHWSHHLHVGVPAPSTSDGIGPRGCAGSPPWYRGALLLECARLIDLCARPLYGSYNSEAVHELTCYWGFRYPSSSHKACFDVSNVKHALPSAIKACFPPTIPKHAFPCAN